MEKRAPGSVPRAELLQIRIEVGRDVVVVLAPARRQGCLMHVQGVGTGWLGPAANTPAKRPLITAGRAGCRRTTDDQSGALGALRIGVERALVTVEWTEAHWT